MEDSQRVRDLEPPRGLEQALGRLFDGEEAVVPDEETQVPPLDVFHHHEGQGAVLPGGEGPHHVGVPDAGHGLPGLMEQAGGARVRQQAQRHQPRSDAVSRNNSSIG